LPTAVFSNNLDSLKAQLEAYQSPCEQPCIQDTLKVDLLISTGFELETTSPYTAVMYYQQAQKLAGEIGDKKWESKAWSYIGIVSWMNGKYDKAIECHVEALELREALGDPLLQAYSLNNIGLVHFYMGNFIEAEKVYRASLAKFVLLANKSGESAAYTNLGLVNRYQGEHDSAIYYYTKSLELDKKSGDQSGVATCYNNLGNTAKDQGDYNKALDYFLKGLDIFEGKNDYSSMAVVYGNIASCYLLSGEYAKALSYGEMGVEMARKSGSLEALKDNSEHISGALTKLGRHDEALTYYKQYIHFKDSLVNIERWQHVDEINTKYNTEKQARIATATKLKLSENKRRLNFFVWLSVIALLLVVVTVVRFVNKRKVNRALKFKNQQIIAQKLRLSETLTDVNKLNDELEKSNRAKDKFFSILAHDLKGPVLSIKQAIAMIHNHFDTFSNQEIKEYLDKLRGSSERANNLLVNLLDWSLSQKGLINYTPDIQNIVEMVDQNVLLKNTLAEQKQIKLNWQSPDIIAVYCDFGMINTVIRNLISNALKFTPPGGEVTISVEDRGDDVKVTVADSGVGMDEDKLKSLFRIDEAQSENGTDGEQGTGLGLILCKEFVDMHNGTISVTSQLESGTEFSFTLPHVEED